MKPEIAIVWEKEFLEVKSMPLWQSSIEKTRADIDNKYEEVLRYFENIDETIRMGRRVARSEQRPFINVSIGSKN